MTRRCAERARATRGLRRGRAHDRVRPTRCVAAAALTYRGLSHACRRNLVRVLRAMQLPRAILLEGSPGVGKTSLIAAMAAACGQKLVRINLSDQTDMMDLLGMDLPRPGGKGGEFVWSDGVFLEALKQGHWVLLDELNLASQSLLEGARAHAAATHVVMALMPPAQA
jgi:midasin (ATPase involved in ribosome maturation)